MADRTQVVVSKGIYQGLPTYPDTADYSGLTAIVTGANGLSGYSMVKVLASSPKWKKIYCLSRRPPPDYFFSELEGGEGRVEHVAADFMAEPEEIAKSLQKIEKVDHAFFFSYMQPKQQGGVLGMWSDADALAEVNAALLRNFLGGLEKANLKPKRVLLQTGAKHYGFHMGNATCPSFETDPRITLENNFYYPQEDILSEYSQRNNSKWNVVRPSYIIGAVRDNILNHMNGLAVYAAVQAYMKKPLYFPGDYAAWDREHCQSTGMMNAYFQEWAVLSENTGNEAFNIQDGNPFTWGRFWAYLAKWYGTPWAPPETDQSKYRSHTSRHDQNPRGYGPAGTTRSTFSLVEWADSKEVQQAWEELKQKHGLLIDPFKDAVQFFGVADSAIVGGWPLSLSIRKARKLGWLGTVDSYEAAFYTMRDLARLKVSVPLSVDKYEEVV